MSNDDNPNNPNNSSNSNNPGVLPSSETTEEIKMLEIELNQTLTQVQQAMDDVQQLKVTLE